MGEVAMNDPSPPTTAEDLFGDQIPLLKPWLGHEEVEAAAEVILSGWVSQGPKVQEFERAVAAYLDADHAVATNSCTSALHLALHLSGVQSGDEVILPAWTCMATSNAVHHAGGVPVFADIDPRTYNITRECAEAVITKRSRAILIVDQIGLPADVDSLRPLAEKFGLVLIEDAACAFGATYRGRRVGSSGHPTTFSFHPRKVITTGEGGMLTTGNSLLAERARRLRATAASVSDLDRHRAKGVIIQQYVDIGYNYRMTDIQAAIGLVQLAKVSAMLRQRSNQASYYDLRLKELPEVEPPHVPAYATHAYSSYLIRLTSECRVPRGTILNRMAERSISCRAGIQPLHREPVYSDRYSRLSFEHSEEAARSTMFLPIYPGLTTGQQDQVVDALTASIRS